MAAVETLERLRDVLELAEYVPWTVRALLAPSAFVPTYTPEEEEDNARARAAGAARATLVPYAVSIPAPWAHGGACACPEVNGAKCATDAPQVRHYFRRDPAAPRYEGKQCLHCGHFAGVRRLGYVLCANQFAGEYVEQPPAAPDKWAAERYDGFWATRGREGAALDAAPLCERDIPALRPVKQRKLAKPAPLSTEVLPPATVRLNVEPRKLAKLLKAWPELKGDDPAPRLIVRDGALRRRFGTGAVLAMMPDYFLNPAYNYKGVRPHVTAVDPPACIDLREGAVVELVAVGE